MGIISLDPAVQVILIPVIIFALSFHEFSHGWMAHRYGDPTAKNAGRLTLNPMAHLDLFGTMALYFMGFGWAKPVPVDPRYLANPKKDMMRIALAGPVSNLILAFTSGVFLSILLRLGIIGSQSPLIMVLIMSLQINLVLAIFNFIPIPPLDGSRILEGLIPYKYHSELAKLEYYGPRVLFGLILISMFTRFNIFSVIISPVMSIFLKLFTFGIY
ncbi:MAG: site-2 protease family protein [Candidatus Marinimicrobia bacterium]|nr:site-2 protease family protein [Candidatus Neomarinimicrobiota bacterium]